MRRVVSLASIGLVLIVSACGGGKALSSSSPSPTASYAPLQVAAAPLPKGEVALAYRAPALQASGGAQPYAFQVVDGAIPGGLQLGADGTLFGLPTASGSFNFTVQLTDAVGNRMTSQSTVSIMPMLTVTPVSSGPIQVEQGCVTACGLFATHVGGQSPLTYSAVSGALPPGMSLSGTSLAGKFTTVGNYQFTVKVTDALGASATVAAAFSVVPHLYFYEPGANGSKVNYDAGTGHVFTCDQGPRPDCIGTMPFTGGVGAASTDYSVTYTIVKGDPTTTVGAEYFTFEVVVQPSITWAPKNINVVIYPPSGLAGWTGTLLVTLTDSAICGPAATAHCSAQAYVLVSVRQTYP